MWISNERCSGDERRLTDCLETLSNSSCVPFEDAGVQCQTCMFKFGSLRGSYNRYNCILCYSEILAANANCVCYSNV